MVAKSKVVLTNIDPVLEFEPICSKNGDTSAWELLYQSLPLRRTTETDARFLTHTILNTIFIYDMVVYWSPCTVYDPMAADQP